MISASIDPRLLMQDLSFAISSELTRAKEHNQPPDVIKLCTATMHVLYVVQLGQPHTLVLWTAKWNQQGDLRLMEVLNALTLLGHQGELSEQDWVRTAVLAMSELLAHFMGSPTTYQQWVGCTSAIIKLLGFKPERGSSVTYTLPRLDSRTPSNPLQLTYTYRSH